MREEHRERKAAREQAAARNQWQERHDAYLELIDTARSFHGLAEVDGLLLAHDETVYLRVDGCALIEERRGRGTYVGHSQGFSVPVAHIGGRPIRYRVGATKGHYVQGSPTPTAIDTGTTFITSHRVVFQGAAQTRECPYAKLVATSSDSRAGSTTFSLSNRARPVTVHYGPDAAPTFEFRLDLALAGFRGTVGELVDGLEADLAAIDAQRPGAAVPTASSATAAASATAATPGGGPTAPPPPAHPAPPPPPAPAPAPAAIAPPPPPPPPPAAVPSAPVPGWYVDPWGRAPLRWWDGAAWSWQTAAPTPPPRDDGVTGGA